MRARRESRSSLLSVPLVPRFGFVVWCGFHRSSFFPFPPLSPDTTVNCNNIVNSSHKHHHGRDNGILSSDPCCVSGTHASSGGPAIVLLFGGEAQLSGVGLSRCVRSFISNDSCPWCEVAPSSLISSRYSSYRTQYFCLHNHTHTN